MTNIPLMEGTRRTRGSSPLKIMTAVLAMLLSPAALAAATTAQDFVNKAAVANMFELESSNVALKNTSNGRVIAFAQQMIIDHTKAASELKSTLGKSGDVKAPDELDNEHTASLNALKSKKDADFDKAYIEDQKKAHDEAVDLFTDYSTNGDNAQLKAFAAKMLPILKSHQKHADTLQTAAMKMTPTDQKAPLVEGRNSFTEKQARDRLSEAGYQSIQGLAKIDKGIWRGQATKEGKAVSVGLDFKGNIAAQ